MVALTAAAAAARDELKASVAVLVEALQYEHERLLIARDYTLGEATVHTAPWIAERAASLPIAARAIMAEHEAMKQRAEDTEAHIKELERK